MLDDGTCDLARPRPLWCRGDARDAAAFCDVLDQFGLTPHETLDLFDPDASSYSTEVLWWWKAARLFSPDRLTGRQPRRLLYTQVDLSRGYSDTRPIERVTSQTAETILVSSLHTDGTHRSALDLDYPARLGHTDTGTYLWLEPSSPALDYHGKGAIDWADRAMAALGLHRAARPEGGWWEDHEARGRAVAALAATWQQPLEPLLDACTAIEKTRRTPLPDGGVWYQVHGGAWLIPSTSWWHLYLDTTLESATYLAAVDVAAAAGLLNPGFANGARERGFTSLRRPGLRKPRTVPFDDTDDIPF
jgi:hypothetical protein